MTARIGPDGFDGKFRADPDPWNTWASRDEAMKRAAIVRGLGPARVGRVLELGSGNGSNTVVLARRGLAVTALDGAPEAVRLTRRAVRDLPRVRVAQAVLPARLPGRDWDAVVIAELLYYLAPRPMDRLAAEIRRVLRPGGRLVLAHHLPRFDDAAQPGEGVHARFLSAAGVATRAVGRVRTGRWQVDWLRRLG